MLNKVQQVRNALIYIIPLGIRGLLPLITLPIFTRILSPEDYGILSLAMIYAIFLSGLANFGISVAYERNYFQYHDNLEKQSQLLFTCLFFIIGNFTLLSITTFIFKNKISMLLTGSPDYGIFILIAFIAHFFYSTANSFFFTYFKNEEKPKLYSRYTVFSIILNFIIALILVAYIQVGVVGIVLAQLIAGVLLFIILFLKLLKELPFSFNRTILIESLKFSYPLTLGTFIKVINTQFDKYMIGLLASVGGVGIYHIGKIISEISFLFMTALQNVFNPQVYKRMFSQQKEDNDSIGGYLTPFIYISICITLCIALFSQEIITILTPPTYHDAIPVLSILSIYSGFLFFGKITGMQLIYSKKSYISSYLTFLSLGLNLGLNIPMIMKFGVIGAAWATMLAGLISGSISMLVAQHYYKVNYEWYKVACIMGTFFSGVIIIVLMRQSGTPYFWSLITKFIFLALFFQFGLRFKILTNENYLIFKNAITSRKISTA